MLRSRTAHLSLIVILLGALLAVGTAPVAADEVAPTSTDIITVDGGVAFLGGRLLGPPQMSDSGRYVVYREGIESDTLRWLDRTTGANRVIADGVSVGAPDISGDGQSVVFVDYDAASVRLWSASSGSIQTLSEPGATFNIVTPSLSFDGRRVLWNETRNGEDAVRLWDRSTGIATSYAGGVGRLSGDGSRIVYIPTGAGRASLVEVATGQTIDLGLLGDLSSDGRVVAAAGSIFDPRSVVFTDVATGNSTVIPIVDDVQLNGPEPVLSGNGRFGFFRTNVSLANEDRNQNFDTYRYDLATEGLAVVSSAGDGTVIDVSADGNLALLWSSTDAGFTLKMLDFSGATVTVAVSISVAAQRSPQLSDQVARLYEAFFLRAPDSQGLAFWMDRRAEGQTLSAIAEQFARSPEFVDRYGDLNDGAFVDLIYLNVQGRVGDAGGVEFWTNRLLAGVPRGEVMVGFSESDEFISSTGTAAPTDPLAASVWRLYRAYYRRGADQGGFDFWYTQAFNGRSLTSIADAFALAPEFTDLYGNLSDDQFVEQVYQSVLGRSPDAGGLQFWRDRMAAGTSRGEVMINFSESPEFVVLTDTLPPA